MPGPRTMFAGGCTLVMLVVASPLGYAQSPAPKTWSQVSEMARSRIVGAEPAEPEVELSVIHQQFEAAPKPQWIWGPETDQPYYLTKALPDGVTAGWLKASGDNRIVVWINDQKVYESDNWQQTELVDIAPSLKPAGNVVRARVENVGGISGAVIKLVLKAANGEMITVGTDNTWVITANEKTRESLPVTVRGELGMAPWRNPFDSRNTPSVPREVFELLPGFQVERLFQVPKEQLGSWVAIAFDNKGRLIVSDQGDKGLYRVTLPAVGSLGETVVEKIDLPITSAQGLLWAFDSLYVSVNGGPGSGLYRIRDTNGDDSLDEMQKLSAFRGGGEHGPHALRLSPDGKSIYVISGNHTQPPFDPIKSGEPQVMGGVRPAPLKTTLPEHSSSRIPTNWDEDLLLPRQWDANGHAVGVLAPGGWIAATDPDGKNWELISVGYRNPYDMDFNVDGELFAYDADMEWDMGSPWYRPTRVVHATSGSEFGWRSGTGKWPTNYPDSLPQVVDIGPGSPVGVAFGTGTRFPAKYQRALYICDWTFGTMYAIHMHPQGASYVAEKEEFLSRSPLPLTDVAVGPDGALYFTVGGRGTQSELYRATYVGQEPIAAVDQHDTEGQELRTLRRKLEQHHAPAADPVRVVAEVWPYLGHADRFIRYAARIAIEQQPLATWQDRVLKEQDTAALITAAIALARQGDPAVQGPLLAALERIPFATLPEAQQLELLRAWSLIFIRLGAPDEATAAKLAQRLDPFYPAKSRDLNRELCNVLVFLNSPTVLPKTLALLQQPDEVSPQEVSALIARNPGYGGSIADMLANQPDTQKMHYLFALRNLKTGWTLEQRKAYFDQLVIAREKSGGNSYRKFLQNIDNDAFSNATEAERLAIEALGARKPYQPPELPKPQGPGQDWTLDSILAAIGDQPLKGRNFENGEKMFAAARCVVCHRFGGDGGATGPDLTQSAGRFALKDLCEAIVDPSKVVSDQYKAVVIETDAGKVYTGRVVSDLPDTLTMVVDPEDATKLVKLGKSEVESQTLSSVSLMPKDLLKTLNQDEVLDLVAYLLSRGNRNDAVFRK